MIRVYGFNQSAKVEWPEHEARWVVLLNDLVFIDSKEIIWKAKAGSIVDGASIPRIIWPIIGSPFVGKYRRASIIHDVFCDIKKRPWQDVHRVFYEMMLVDGVNKKKAWLMYQAVYFGGPRW